MDKVDEKSAGLFNVVIARCLSIAFAPKRNVYYRKTEGDLAEVRQLTR